MVTGHTGTSDDTIAAIATATGGGVGIIRVSGPAAISVAKRFFKSKSKTLQPGRLHYGQLVDATGRVLDEGMVVIFPGPRSFTGEDVCELHLHGGTVHLQLCLGVIVGTEGVRLAGPGEFLRRAFLNDRIDLTRSEAIADLIAARTERAVRLARAHLQGGLYDAAMALRDAILRLRAAIEVNIDFVDEDVPLMDPVGLIAQIDGLLADLDTLLATHATGRRVTEGARIVLAGPPNVGKSSLFNALCGSSRAIVTPVAGTTRDMITEQADVRGVPVTLCDTAGLRETKDAIEAMGIARTRDALAEADLIVELIPPRASGGGWDCDQPPLLTPAEGQPFLRVLAKADLVSEAPRRAALEVEGIPFSAHTGEGLEALREAMAERLGVSGEEGLVIARERHRLALCATRDALLRARDALEEGLTPELPAVDLQDGLDALAELVGLTTVEDMLDRLFSTFCIGK